MAEEDLLPFYQQFYSESLFIIPEEAAGTLHFTKSATLNLPGQPIESEIIADGDLTPAPKKFIIAGENRKGLALLFSLPEPDFVALPGNGFLTKILAAINHTPVDVAYINIPPNNVLNLFDLAKETPVKHVVAFGKDLVDLAVGFQINLYKPAGIGDTSLILADPLQNIENDVNRKKLLWNGLQAIFLK